MGVFVLAQMLAAALPTETANPIPDLNAFYPAALADARLVQKMRKENHSPTKVILSASVSFVLTFAMMVTSGCP